MLDAIYHLATNTAVHINYMTVKFTLILLILFLTTFWVGKGFNHGLFSIILGPIIFYIYYIFADPTLNREIFKLDESFGYIFLHILVFAISYYVFYQITSNKNISKKIKIAGTALILSLTIVGLDSAYELLKTQLITNNEELVVKALNFDTTLYFIFSLITIIFISYYYIQNIKLKISTIVLATILLNLLIFRDLTRSFSTILTSSLPQLLFRYYTKWKINF